MTTLDISIVVYAPQLEALAATLTSLSQALNEARNRGLLERAHLWLIDNGTPAESVPGLESAYRRFCESATGVQCDFLTGHGNVGYGRGHNLAIRQAAGHWHLVLNPDVEIRPDAIAVAIDYMKRHPDVCLLSPRAEDRHGQRQYLAKRYPAVVDLVLRGFAPGWIRRAFVRRLDRYEMRELATGNSEFDIPIASGCFMFFRRDALRATGGFSDDFFLYFEDFDLSLRAARHGRIVHVPAVGIVHHGGHAAKKGWRHVHLFVRSMFLFYRKHGWKLF
jgi:hypothetical protein